MGRVVIPVYRPKPGKEAELLAAVRDHLRVLRGEGLVTDRAPVVMRAQDGSIVEVFEWQSAEAIERAHHNPEVHKLWARFEAACEYTTLSSLSEASQMFAEFELVEFGNG
ncbi:MAG: hypothetical protein ACT4QE_12110 [Anaerolineales bacterium]